MKHFKNVTSYKDLKDQYKRLLKANHPDNGGDLEVMQEINCEYDILFKIWKGKAEKENIITEEEKEETAQSTRRNFYTAFGWEGSRYDSNLTLKEIAKIVRGYVKEKYPNCKFSVRTHYASMCQSLSIDFLEFPDRMYKTSEELKEIYYTPFTYVNSKGEEVSSKHISDIIQNLIHTLRNNNLFNLDSWTQDEFLNYYQKIVFEENRTYFGIKTEIFQNVIDDINSFVASYNYSDCDGQIDYYNVNFYGGKVDVSSCKQVEKVARIKKQKCEPATAKEQETMQIETSGELFTVEESKHTKTGDKIYLVRCLETLTKKSYINLNNQIKQIGGYYSKFTHSFVFKNDPTELLKEVKIV